MQIVGVLCNCPQNTLLLCLVTIMYNRPALIAASLLAAGVGAFQPARRTHHVSFHVSHFSASRSTASGTASGRSTRAQTRLFESSNKNNGGSGSGSGEPEFVVGDNDDYSGDVDWDSEWQKVVREQNAGGGKKEQQRPGKDFYKSDLERKAIRATNRVAEQVTKVKVQAPDFKVPEIRSLQGDWRVRMSSCVVSFRVFVRQVYS
mmetsp:Transcript_24940/g.51042  ORF Transcript_24940/g.51042 Transcript_24940/m.51042 type:complete len:204 (+) Transcript_24940:87-698(+)